MSAPVSTLVRFQSFLAAVITPFNPDGSVNYERIDELAAYLVQHDIGAFVIGTTGESASLTIEERKKVAERWRHAYPRPAPSPNAKVLVHVGSTSVEESKGLARHAKEIGADGFVAQAPFYFKPPTVEVLVGCMSEIASAAPDLPFYYYHIPQFTNVTFNVREFLEKASPKIPNLAGVKLTYTDFADVLECAAFQNKKYNVMFGRDSQILQGLIAGAEGAVGSTYQIPFMIPVYTKLFSSYRAGDLKAAQAEAVKAVALASCLSRNGRNTIASLKSILKFCGYDVGTTRLPCVPLSPTEEGSLHAELKSLGFL